MDPMITWLAAAVVLVGVVRYIFKRAADKKFERAAPASSSAIPLVSPRAAALPGRSPLRDDYRQPILRAVGYDEEKVDRLVAMERKRLPGATDEQLHVAAYERWLQDNR